MAHEDLNRAEATERSSDRSFGLIFAAAFLVISLLPLIHNEAPRLWAFAVAVPFALAAGFRPAILAPLNSLWAKFGAVLARVVSPVALGVVFYGVFTPIGAAGRLLGKDPLRLKREPDLASYWISREPPGSMTHPF